MRFFYSLTALTILLASTAGFLFWQTYRPALVPSNEVTNKISQIKTDFTAQTKPLLEIPLEEFRRSRHSSSLGDPKLTFPQITSYPLPEISRVAQYAENCKKDNPTQKVHSISLQKALLWHQFLCGKMAVLPQGFFEGNPWIHPSGASYVLLAVLSGHPEFSHPLWLKNHTSGLHLLEILNREPFRTVGLKVSAWDLQKMLNGESLILTANHTLFSVISSSPIQSAVKYKVYSRKEWDRFIASQQIAPSTSNSPSCLFHEGSICWVQNSEPQNLQIRVAAILLLFGFITLGIALIVTVVKRSNLKKLDAVQRMFILQMLAHELRTPATALRLSLESQRREFDLLPFESQRAFLQMCEELQRLDRIIEASKNYLKSQNQATFLDSTEQSELSVNELIERILEPFIERVRFHPLTTEKKVSLDPYWIEICVKNLVENALIHGSPPVTVGLTEELGILVISVVDQGTVSFYTLNEMTKPFQKVKTSSGLGLGLVIVEKVVQKMGGKLIFKNSPTTFSIQLRAGL